MDSDPNLVDGLKVFHRHKSGDIAGLRVYPMPFLRGYHRKSVSGCPKRWLGTHKVRVSNYSVRNRFTSASSFPAASSRIWVMDVSASIALEISVVPLEISLIASRTSAETRRT